MLYIAVLLTIKTLEIMGDYTKKGEKIGTCGNAYYATKEMLETLYNKDSTESEAKYYLNPDNKCSFAFPFPKYDGKKIGEISNFHEEDRAEFTFSFKTDESAHKDIVSHIHPKGAAGINLFTPCPYSEDGKVSSNLDKKNKVFRLIGQTYVDGDLLLTAECVYCKCVNVFSNEESLKLAEQIREGSKKLLNDSKNDYYHASEMARYRAESERQMKIVDRIIEMVEGNVKKELV